MKFALALLFTAFGAVAHAQPIYQCKDTFGNDAFQGRPCADPLMVADNSDYAGSQTDFAPRISYGAPRDTTGWGTQLRRQLRQNTRHETQAVSMRVERFLKPFHDQQQVQYEQNRQRCERALRVAAMCGKPAEYSCGEKGFVVKPALLSGSTRALSNEETYKLERCTLHASKGKI